MAMMAISIGKIAVMRLKASADAKPITQSLLNLVKKSRRVFALSLAAHLTPEVLCRFAPVAMASFLLRLLLFDTLQSTLSFHNRRFCWLTNKTGLYTHLVQHMLRRKQ